MNQSETYNPHITVYINNIKIKDINGLFNISIVSHSSKPSVCEISFANNMSLKINSNFMETELKVILDNNSVPIFNGYITSTEYSINSQGDYLYHIRAYDYLIKLAKTQNISGSHNKNLKDIINESDPSIKINRKSLVSSFKWRNILPFQECDLDFITRNSAKIGLYFVYINNKLNFYTLDDIDAEEITKNINNEIIDLKVKSNSIPNIDNVIATSWDIQELELIKTKEKSKNNLTIYEITSNEKNEIKIKSEARLKYNKANTRIIELVIIGDPNIHPGKRIKINGLEDKINGIVNKVEHSIDNKNGFITKISTEPVKIKKMINPVNGTIANISDINDPENMGRVKVKLPSINNYESDWLPLLIPGGGKGHGMIFFPSPGDLVYLTFLNGDVTKGVILGGLPGIENDGLDQISLLIDKSQSIRINKKKKSIKIENNGSRLEMTKSKIELYSKEDINIKAPSKTINITGQNINFIKG